MPEGEIGYRVAAITVAPATTKDVAAEIFHFQDGGVRGHPATLAASAPLITSHKAVPVLH